LDGGAIYIKDGTLVVHDSTFDTNTARIGGAIWAVNADVTIHDTEFILNNVGSNGKGGAIYIQDGTLVVHDSTFDTNTADYSGGVEQSQLSEPMSRSIPALSRPTPLPKGVALLKFIKAPWKSTTAHSRAPLQNLAGVEQSQLTWVEQSQLTLAPSRATPLKLAEQFMRIKQTSRSTPVLSSATLLTSGVLQ
jgi:hypothetical protein